MEREELKQRIIDLVKVYGDEDGKLYIFNYCCENGRGLDDSTIDAIVVDGGDVKFWYNYNMKDDYVYMEHFNLAELESFIGEIESDLVEEYGLTMQEFNENKAYIEEHMNLTSEKLWDDKPLSVELESWTEKEGDMIISLDTLSKSSLKEWLDTFDIENEVEIWWPNGLPGRGVPYKNKTQHRRDLRKWLGEMKRICRKMPH